MDLDDRGPALPAIERRGRAADRWKESESPRSSPESGEHDLKIPPGANAAHLCVDMQRLFSSEGPWPTPWMDRVLPKVIKLIERSPNRTIFTLFLTPRVAEDMSGQSKWSNVTRGRLDNRLLNPGPI
jgi:hypothetical protein